MNRLLKRAVFHIAVRKNDGITEKELLKLLHEEFDGVFSFKDDDIMVLLRATPEILRKNGEFMIKSEATNLAPNGAKKNENSFVVDKDIQNYVLKNNLLNRHFHNDENQEESEAIFQMYQEIVKAGPSGISYEELSEIFSKKAIKGLTKQKLETYMVSNYCRKLAKHNFINIAFQNTRRLVIDVRFNKVAVENFLNPSKKNVENANSQQANANAEDLEDQQQKQQRQEQQKEINSVTQENIIEYLNKETFTIRELSQRQNIVLNLESQYAQKNDGLTTKDICLKIRMLHEKKALDRIIKSIEKVYKVETIAVRMGKSYSHKFVIRNQAVKNYKPPIDFSSDVKLEDPETYGLVKAENEDLESSSDVVNTPANASAKKSHLPPVLHYEVFKDMLTIIAENSQFKEFIENNGESLAKLNEIKASDEDYAKVSERILKLLVDNEAKLFGDAVEPESKNQGFSKKSLTRLKLNRYIFILNKVREHEITTNIALKNMIISEIEVGTGWKIDRKTLRSLLNLLQRFGLIKLQDYKFNYLFNNYKSEQKDDVQFTRTMILARKISPNDPRIQTILAKSNMANLKKEAEAAKVSSSKHKRARKEKEAIFLEDGEDSETGDTPVKKIKPLEEAIESIKKKKNEFEKIVGDSNTRLKKFDFSSCKLLANEYKIMMFVSYFETLFKRKATGAKQLCFKVLKQHDDIKIYDYLNEAKKTLSSSVSSLVCQKKYSQGFSENQLNLFKTVTSNTASHADFLSYDIKNRNMCEAIGKQFEKKFYAQMEARFEVDKIFKQSQTGPTTTNKRLDSLLSLGKDNNQRVWSNNDFVQKLQKRIYSSSILLNEEDRQKNQRDQSRLASLVASSPAKNVDQVLTRHAKIPERKGILEHMGVSEDLVFKEIEPLAKPNKIEIEPGSFKYVTRIVQKDELEKALEKKNVYLFVPN